VEVVPAGPKAVAQAEAVRVRLLNEVDERRHPRTSATVDQLLDRHFALATWEPTTRDTYVGYAETVKQAKWDLVNFLIAEKREGKRIAAYGAPAKGNTLLNYCGIRTDLIDFTADLSPHKQGRYLPGTHIPILAPEAIAEAKPDLVLILPWNLKDEIVEQLSFVREWGGQFVVRAPRLAVLP